MRIILPPLQEPPDVVVAGDQSYLAATQPPLTTWALNLIPQGPMGIVNMPALTLPMPMVSLSDWFGILPRTIAPMVLPGGNVIMQQLGNVPTSLFVDPITAFLESCLPIDVNGNWVDWDTDMMGAFEAVMSWIVQGDQTVMNNINPTLPRAELLYSGSLKNMQMPTLPAQFGQHMMEYYTETTQRLMISGTTLDSTGAALGNCRVVVLRTDKITENYDAYANPVEGEVTSDGSGNFAYQANINGPYQLIAYKPGSPDVAGITVNNLIGG